AAHDVRRREPDQGCAGHLGQRDRPALGHLDRLRWRHRPGSPLAPPDAHGLRVGHPGGARGPRRLADLGPPRRLGVRRPSRVAHGGHTRNRTLPTMDRTGTGPNERESNEPRRWSPSRNTEPGGTRTGPKKVPSTWARSTYGSGTAFPSTFNTP